jgi:hypothetical protein
VTPVFFSTVAVALPHGCASWQTTVVTPALFRSAKDAIPFGFPGAVTMTSVLVAKIFGSVALSPSFSMFFSSAEANTSAGAPCLIWLTSVDDPSNDSDTLTPSFSFSNSPAIAVKVFFNDAAAYTLSVTGPDAAELDAASSPSSDEQPATTSRAATPNTAPSFFIVVLL